jgi:hypothetical protein
VLGARNVKSESLEPYFMFNALVDVIDMRSYWMNHMKYVSCDQHFEAHCVSPVFVIKISAFYLRNVDLFKSFVWF